MDCDKCGVRLEPPGDGVTVVRCQHCGNMTAVGGRPPVRRARPTPTYRLAAAVDPIRAPGPRRPIVALGAVAIIAAAAAAIGVVVFVVHGAARPDHPPPAASPARADRASAASDRAAAEPAAPAPLRWQSAGCMLDANGDDVLDVGGLAGHDPSHVTPTVVDGATGKVLWRGDALQGDHGRAFCPGNGWLGVDEHDPFVVELYPASSPHGMIRHVLSESLRDYGVGQDCIRLTSADDHVIGLALPGGEQTHCDAPASSASEQDAVVDGITHDTRLAVHSDGVTYALSDKREGTAFLEVAAHKGPKSLWSSSLGVARAGGATGALGIVATPGVVVVVGADPQHDGRLTLVGLAEDSGVERWSAPLETGPTVRVRSLGYNHRYVVLSASGNDELVALDPASGHIAWRHAGG